MKKMIKVLVLIWCVKSGLGLVDAITFVNALPRERMTEAKILPPVEDHPAMVLFRADLPAKYKQYNERGEFVLYSYTPDEGYIEAQRGSQDRRPALAGLMKDLYPTHK